MPQQILIMDPYHPYAIRFIERYYRIWGMKSVCFYTDPEQFHYEAWRYPELRSEMIEASYAVPRSRVLDLVPILKQKHDIAAVVPHNDLAVVASEELAEALGLDWAQPGVIELFRDKFALKELLRSLPDAPRINGTARVGSVTEIRASLSDGRFARFVLKPIDGYGNQNVGFFDDQTSDDELATYLQAVDRPAVLMEELLDGREFWVNGQIDGSGNVTILAVFESLVQDMNGRDNVPVAHPLIHSDDPVFEPLARYATEVMRASGLKRSPFHMEVIVDEQGPCMVEVGARMMGQHASPEMDEVHGSDFDVFTLAAHYYLTAEDFGPIDLDWEFYNSREFRILLGTSSSHDRIYELNGIAEVGALPEFLHWIDKPFIGQRIVPRTDLFSSPWQAVIAGQSNEYLDSIEARIRQTIGWNQDAHGAGRAFKKARAFAAVANRKFHERQKLFGRIPLQDVPLREHA